MDKLSREERAKRLLKKLKRPKEKEAPERPFFIEITGSPDSGKTTMIHILDPFFRRQGFRVYTPQEGAEVIRHIPRTNHLYNIRTGLYALTTLIDASVNTNYDLVIFDRCLYDVYSWMLYWQGEKDIDHKEKDLLQDFFCFHTWLDMLDATFFVITTPEEAAKRDQTASLTKKFGGTTSPESLKNLVSIFKFAYENFTCQHTSKDNIFLIDTTGLEVTEMTEMVLEKTLNALEQRFKK